MGTVRSKPSPGAGDAEPFLSWARSALLGEPAPPPTAGAGLQLRRQDHGELRRRSSVLGTPLRLGGRGFDRGLGTHALSELVVHLPGPGAVFEAEVGVDDNPDTGGRRGSVEFVVEVGGAVRLRTGVRRGGDKPLPVRVSLNGETEFTLKVTDAGDGTGWDQADWAGAAVTLVDGRRLWLDELPDYGVPLLTPALPFSFLLDGSAAHELLAEWPCRIDGDAALDGARHALTWTDPDGGLAVRLEARLFEDVPAAEWVVWLRNLGDRPTALIEGLLALDVQVAPPSAEAVLHHAHGSTCTCTDFLPLEEALKPGAPLELAPNGGRSSDGRLPFFHLAWPGGGLLGAIGWSGQWRLRAERGDDRRVALQAGQATFRAALRPGEAVRTPRMLLLGYTGEERLEGHQRLRRVMLEHYLPQRDGQPILPPVACNTWFKHDTGNAVTEANQLELIEALPSLGVEAFWLDAGWFEGGWPRGAGSWVPKAEAFPRGLKPLGDAARERGLGFVLWFEPERVCPGTRLDREHPDWVLRAGDGDGLLDLGSADALAWLTDHLDRCISEWGITVLRQDFNIAPLRFWQASDAEAAAADGDRQGIAENRYVQGLYALWDELRRRHPHLAIDNCASGGRRIDLETCTRSFPLWRSDTQCCGRPMCEWDQVQSIGLSLWVPLHAAGTWGFDPYTFRSVTTTGVSLCLDIQAEEFAAAQAGAAIAEAKSLRPYWLGEALPLLPITLQGEDWCAWQMHRPDLDAGFAVFFRRPASAYVTAEVSLRGLDPAARYTVTLSPDYAPGEPRIMTGEQLARLRVTLDEAPGSVLLRYCRR